MGPIPPWFFHKEDQCIQDVDFKPRCEEIANWRNKWHIIKSLHLAEFDKNGGIFKWNVQVSPLKFDPIFGNAGVHYIVSQLNGRAIYYHPQESSIHEDGCMLFYSTLRLENLRDLKWWLIPTSGGNFWHDSFKANHPDSLFVLEYLLRNSQDGDFCVNGSENLLRHEQVPTVHHQRLRVPANRILNDHDLCGPRHALCPSWHGLHRMAPLFLWSIYTVDNHDVHWN